MDKHTHPAAETVTLLAAEAAAGGAVAAAQQRVDDLAARLGVGGAR